MLLVTTLTAATPAAESPQSRPASSPEATSRPSKAAVFAASSRIARDVPYVPNAHDQQKLDIYAPPNVHGAPVVIYVHGGEWAKGDKNEASFKPRFFNENGVVFVSINYRLSGVARHPTQVDDVAAAIRWTRDHIREYGGDANKLILMGHSAGCHLVTLVGLDPRILSKAGLAPGDLRLIVSWSGGAFDLNAKVAEGGMYAGYIRQNFGSDPEVWRDASPLTHAKANRRPTTRFLFVTAEQDKPASRAINRTVCDLLKQAGGKAELLDLPGKTHFTADYEVGMPGDSTGAQLLDHIREVLTD